MKIASKLICLLLALAMVFTVAGCGGNGDSSDTGSSGNNTGNSANNAGWQEIKAKIPADAKGKTIEVFSWNDLTDVTGAVDVVEQFENETGIKIEWVKGSYNEYSTKIAARVASQDSPDIVRLMRIDTGLIRVLEPLQNIDFDFTDEAWDTRIMDFYTFDGKTYGTNMRNTLLQQPRALLYNKNLINRFDLEDPYSLWKQGNWNWEKFEEICKTFKEEVDDDTYLPWTSYQWADAGDAYGSAMIKREGDRFVSNMSDPNLLKGWQKMCQLREDGITNNIRFDINNFENGKILFFTESLISVRRTHFYWKSLKAQGALAAVPFPTIDGGTNATVWSEVEAYAIPQGAPCGSLAPFFLRYYLDSENYDKNTFFCDPTMLDVHEALMKAENMYVNYDCGLITDDIGKGGIHINASIINAKPANASTKLNEYSNLVDAAVKSTNDVLDKLK
ncbi:MAG: extracellular solute-binding protein [Clostridia bacterium]|nr:extracellular solute-binding protein [Clostridia bacterium]